MGKKYLVVNLGSTSKKYSIYENGKLIFNSHLSNKENAFISDILFADKIIENKKEIEAIAIRIVAPGMFFLKNRVINKKYVSKLKYVQESAPLHVKPVLTELKLLKKEFPGVKIVGISDTRFHKDMIPEARYYGIKKSDADNLELYRYGYHGISMESVVEKIKPLPKKTIICHLGGGSSIAAVMNGKSIETSMGFTPLEGLMGGTRVGNFNFGAGVYFAEKKKMKFRDLEIYLNTKSGLLGLGGSSDMRVLLSLEKSKNKTKAKQAKTAVDKFTYDIRKYIGAYKAVMDGLDLLVFTGVMGADSDIIRKRVCEQLTSFGIKLDKKKNLQGNEGYIHTRNSKVKIMIVNSNENEKMYKEAKKLA